ncbi:hypothetical protein AMAG_05912 [Allomyces macrogynus ATCC 38327]|uniref:Centromere protein X n=1 Tax=Allomyces macrogynus (strain ATCC 38327) TaxID=578462 RepID=A0A0L0SDH2_ALLM3|nr:hypothetical protein AMAG_05912 [Allomyces macrogynus ATCC 38327]|eukprot:KNE60531.1 hypothetical protein AMAG_05912 [Allomyces macrogynus ATCC 38327]
MLHFAGQPHDRPSVHTPIAQHSAKAPSSLRGFIKCILLRDCPSVNMSSKDSVPRPETLLEVFKGQWTDPSLKMNKEALDLAVQLTRLFTLEALHRSAAACVTRSRRSHHNVALEGEPEIQIADLEMVLPQLLLDFS